MSRDHGFAAFGDGPGASGEIGGRSLYREHMHGGIVRRDVVGVAVLCLVVALGTACGGETPEPTSLPTFPTSAGGAGQPTGPGSVEGDVPDDCARILKESDLGALLGLPLDSVAVRSTLGVPQPAVGRTERIACRYTGTPGGPARGRTLLDLNVSAYSDPAAAAAQWRVNADAEDGERSEFPIGSATAVLVERPKEAVLAVAYHVSNLSFVLPEGPLPGGRTPRDALVDLALRVLPTVVQAPEAPPPTTPPPPASSEASGTSVRSDG